MGQGSGLAFRTFVERIAQPVRIPAALPRQRRSFRGNGGPSPATALPRQLRGVFKGRPEPCPTGSGSTSIPYIAARRAAGFFCGRVTSGLDAPTLCQKQTILILNPQRPALEAKHESRALLFLGAECF